MKFPAHFGCVKWIDNQQNPAKAKFGHVIGFVAFPETMERIATETEPHKVAGKKPERRTKKGGPEFITVNGPTKVEYVTKKVILMAMIISKGMKKPVMVQADILEYV